MAADLYATLELQRGATTEEIKRSFYRLVRLHPPSKEAEKYQELREAYETLSDERARESYHQLQDYGDEVAELTEEAEDWFEAEDWDEAIRCYKEILSIMPSSVAAWNRLGLCYLHDDRPREAIPVFNRAISLAPETSLYLMNLGHAHMELADTLTAQGKTASIMAAREAFQRAVELDRLNAQPYVMVAQTYRMQENYREAIAWAERAVGADGKTDFADFDALFEICMFQLFAKNLSGVVATARRIQGLVPDDPEVRQYVSVKFGATGVELYNVQAFKEATTFFDAAIQFDPQNPKLREIRKDAQNANLATEEWKRMDEDEQVPTPLKMASWVFIMDLHEEEVPDRETTTRRISQQLAQWPDGVLYAGAVRIRQLYPHIFALNKDFFGQFVGSARPPQLGRTAPPQQTVVRATDGQSSGGGCVIVFVAATIGNIIGGTVGAVVGLVIGYFIVAIRKS